MEYNTCKHCGASDGRAGMLINNPCINCNDTKNIGDVVIHSNLKRAPEELDKTM